MNGVNKRPEFQYCQAVILNLVYLQDNEIENTISTEQYRLTIGQNYLFDKH